MSEDEQNKVLYRYAVSRALKEKPNVDIARIRKAVNDTNKALESTKKAVEASNKTCEATNTAIEEIRNVVLENNKYVAENTKAIEEVKKSVGSLSEKVDLILNYLHDLNKNPLPCVPQSTNN